MGYAYERREGLKAKILNSCLMLQPKIPPKNHLISNVISSHSSEYPQLKVSLSIMWKRGKIIEMGKCNFVSLLVKAFILGWKGNSGKMMGNCGRRRIRWSRILNVEGCVKVLEKRERETLLKGLGKIFFITLKSSEMCAKF
jgi:hypothetical protein